MHVLVFGSTGQVARELARSKWAEGTTLTHLDRQAADLSEVEALAGIVDAKAPDAIIIAAAYTRVDGAESDEASAMAVNAHGPAAIAGAAAERSIPVVYFSTDYVFDGTKDGPYEETDPVRPINAYGRSKLAGENAIRTANPRHLILRTSWVYSAHGSNFLTSMLRAAKSRDEVRVVSDQWGCPTAAGDLADTVAGIMPALVSGEAPSGTYHLAGGMEATWHGFAEAIFETLAARGLKRPANVPIATADYPTEAARPRNSRLSSQRFARDFGARLKGYRCALPAVLDEALAANRAENRA